MDLVEIIYMEFGGTLVIYLVVLTFFFFNMYSNQLGQHLDYTIWKTMKRLVIGYSVLN